ncbi:hypothetical protein FJY63_06615, partial [Candidatus Sumerlaeota bacterium]|nr:hypothetical protein [Candidatus Sumerlaeota bacterium]
VYVAGVGSYVSGMDKYLEQNLSCPVAAIPPPPTLEFAQLKTGDLREAWAEFATTIGAGTGGTLPAVNLLPTEYVEGLRLRQSRRSLVITAVLAVLLIGVGIAYALRWGGDKRHALGFYEEHNSALEPEVRRLRDKEKRYEIIQRVVKDPHSAGVILEAICQTPPVMGGQVKMIVYHYTQGDEVTLEGHALTATDVDLLKAELEKLRFFAEVLVETRQRTNLPPDRPKTDVYTYKIRCKFSQSAAR